MKSLDLKSAFQRRTDWVGELAILGEEGSQCPCISGVYSLVKFRDHAIDGIGLRGIEPGRAGTDGHAAHHE